VKRKERVLEAYVGEYASGKSEIAINRANERNEILPLEEWVKDINEVTKKYGLI
jgi:hypothetical protein